MARAQRGSRATRLRKTWVGGIIDNVVLTTTQVALQSVAIAEGAIADTTVLRCRGNLLFTALPDAGGDTDVVGVGLVVVTENALGIGGTSLPGPINDPSSDAWLWHTFVPLDAFGATTEGAAQLVNSTQARVEIDAKAMRKLPEAYGCVLVAELATGDFASVNVSGGIRFLLGS